MSLLALLPDVLLEKISIFSIHFYFEPLQFLYFEPLQLLCRAFYANYRWKYRNFFGFYATYLGRHHEVLVRTITHTYRHSRKVSVLLSI
jgi:hypothetical protein